MADDETQAQSREKRTLRSYTKADRLEAIGLYATTGNCALVARELGMPDRTVRHWVTDAYSGDDEDGAAVLADRGRKLRAKLIDQLERGMGRAAEAALDRINDKDWALNFKGDPTPQYLSGLSGMYGRLQDAERVALEREGKLPQQGASITIVTKPVPDE